VRAGTLKIFAQMTPKRSPAVSDVPTANEGGVQG
jgi:tripartite-type tricarboxylate transporter receptor subunit TctC